MVSGGKKPRKKPMESVRARVSVNFGLGLVFGDFFLRGLFSDKFDDFFLDQLFSRTYLGEHFCLFCSFTSVMTQNNIVKNLLKSHQKITVMRFFFSENESCDVAQERTA